MSDGNQQRDSSMDIVWIIFAVFIAVSLIAKFLGDDIVRVYLMMRSFWINLYIHVIPTDLLIHAREAIEIYRPKEWASQDLKQLSEDLKYYMFIPMGSIFAWYAFYVINKNPTNSFKRVHTRQSLCESEVSLWPWVAPVLKLNLTKEPIDKGKWAMSRPPLEFARKYRLLDDGKTLNRKRAEKLFAAQLGRLWNGPEKLPPYLYALLACFVAQACRDKESAREGLQTLAVSFAAGKPDYSFAKGLMKQYYKDPRIQKCIGKNAYMTTVMCSVLEAARANGVLPPNYFIWLRPINRGLWYALNGVGRKTPFCETAGIHAHRQAEQVAGYAIERPYVEGAVEALEKALREVKIED